MLLIGMKTNFIKYPTTPMTANPIAQEEAIFINSKKFLITNLKIKKATFFIGFSATVNKIDTISVEVLSAFNKLGGFAF